MNWAQATFVVDAKQVDPVSAMLEMFLAQAVTTENAGEDEYYEVAFPGNPSWQKVKLTALFDDSIDLTPIINFVQEQLTNTANGEVPVTISKLVDQDWERVWLSSFKPIEVGTNLWICPSWCEPVDSQARNIILDPGLAFGTGTHPTTNMCLNWLAEQRLARQQVLDYGSGSGILAIASIMSGAMRADAVDIDPQAVKACIENAQRNNVANSVHAYLPKNLSEKPHHRYDLVIANILAEVIIELRDTLLLHLKTNGVILLTGILSTQADRVIEVFGNDFDYKLHHQEQWCLIEVTKKIPTNDGTA